MTKDLRSDRERDESAGMDGGQLISESSEARYVPKDAGKLAHVDPSDIIDRIANGALQREVAAEHGVSQQAVSLFIDRHVPPTVWNQVRRKSIESRIEMAAERIDAADDALVLARARESARLWMWRAEREHPDVWGAKQQIDMRVTTTDLGDRLRAAKERVIGTGSTVASAQQTDASAAQQLPIAQDLTGTSK